MACAALTAYGARPREDAHALYRRMTFNVLVSIVDDHLRNHGMLHAPGRGWQLSPAYDLNPVPSDLKARVLATNIDEVEGSCSIALVREVAPLFDLERAAADANAREVADATRRWRDVAARIGERPNAIERMASAFEHADLDTALSLCAARTWTRGCGSAWVRIRACIRRSWPAAGCSPRGQPESRARATAHGRSVS